MRVFLGSLIMFGASMLLLAGNGVRAQDKKEDAKEVSLKGSVTCAKCDLGLETKLNPEIASWLAFAVQKIEELATLSTALGRGRGEAGQALKGSDAIASARKTSSSSHWARNDEVSVAW